MLEGSQMLSQNGFHFEPRQNPTLCAWGQHHLHDSPQHARWESDLDPRSPLHSPGCWSMSTDATKVSCQNIDEKSSW